MSKSITVKAPSSTANLGPGFDVFGLALDAFYDEIKITTKQSGISIKTQDAIPVDPKKNTAGIVAKIFQDRFKIKTGLEIEIKKGVPAGFGIGSSAASASATAFALNKLFGLKLDNNSLVELAGQGEKASAGSIHYDNVAASLFGGFVIVRTNPVDVIKIEPPKDLVLILGIPKLKVPPKKTKISRSVIPKKVPISDSVVNLSNASAIVAGFMKKDSKLIGKSIKDIIVEPARKHLIPGFDYVKKNALKEGALGVTISGAGPTIIAFCTKNSKTKKIEQSIIKGFKKASVNCQTLICKPSIGAHIKS